MSVGLITLIFFYGDWCSITYLRRLHIISSRKVRICVGALVYEVWGVERSKERGAMGLH